MANQRRAEGGCRWLRWKTLYLERELDEAVPDMVDGFVWCVHTMNCLGPDGEVAGHDQCRPTRACHEPLVVLRGPDLETT